MKQLKFILTCMFTHSHRANNREHISSGVSRCKKCGKFWFGIIPVSKIEIY